MYQRPPAVVAFSNIFYLPRIGANADGIPEVCDGPVTTGATVNECASILTQAGAHSVDVVAVSSPYVTGLKESE
jgi:hypothetical protein